jgi:hypothetical protein
LVTFDSPTRPPNGKNCYIQTQLSRIINMASRKAVS